MLAISQSHDSPDGIPYAYLNWMQRSPEEKKAVSSVLQRVEEYLTGSELGSLIDKVQLHGSTVTNLDSFNRLA